MSKTFRTPIVKASPNIKIHEPRISKFVIFLVAVFGRLYLFLFFGIARIVAQGGEKNLIGAFERSLSGKSRCIIAFRHPNGGEPPLLSWYFLFKFKHLARRHGVRFPMRPHSVFVYGYEVARWGGAIARFIMPNLGAMPIHHSKMDRPGMTRIFKAITDGCYPVALAPEGQVSYTTDAVPRLEPGVIRIGFRAAERLADKKSDCPLEILPVSVYFRFGVWGKNIMESLLKKIEKLSGLSARGRKKLPFAERVSQCRDYVLRVNEKRYQLKTDASQSFEERLEQVINAALETAERMMGIKGEGDFFDRLYKVRQYCWDRIYLPEIDDLDGMARIERNVLDMKAGEAWYISRHQELADFCWYFRTPIPSEDAALHNKIEYVQNLWDFASRTMGGAYSNRVSIFPRKVIVQAAPIINLSERLSSFKKDSKAAIAEAMSDLEKAYLDNIAEANKGEEG